ncbi:MAG: 16S rRNA (cytosine(1402)-N(4))-methyltransferase, partial [Anaerolineae bacterium]|nr:16S rRNA (cytosine(1402)-N(4))-methyltransferase [Anaerolineae bacterium]
MTEHIPVLLAEVLDALLPAERLIDGTLGAGGHTRALLDAGAGAVLAFDADPTALEVARAHLAGYENRVTLVNVSYVEMAQHAQRLGWQAVDGILLDLGLSSMQLDTTERGFAFMHDAPLDMRFNQHSREPTAADLL